MGNSSVSPAAARHGSHSDSIRTGDNVERPDRIESDDASSPASARTDGRSPTHQTLQVRSGVARRPRCSCPHTADGVRPGRSASTGAAKPPGVRHRSRLHPRSSRAGDQGRAGCLRPRTAGWLAADFRGHGRSGGRSSVGRDETLDLDAVVRWTRDQGYGPGLSSSGSRWAPPSRCGTPPSGSAPGDAVVSVSSPSRWYIRESAPMRRVQWLLEKPVRGTRGPSARRPAG